MRSKGIYEVLKKIQEYRNDYIDEYGAKNEIKMISKEFIDNTTLLSRIYYSLFLSKEYKSIKKIANKTDEVVEEWNNQYIDGMKYLHQDFFSNIEGLALDEQQQTAIITDDNYNLIIAGAGSGKTLTVASKVKYLTEIKGVKPEDILLLSFTKKAADEMTERIKEKMGVPVAASTFHSLGNKIILETEGKKADLETDIERIVWRYFKTEVPKNNEMIINVLNFVGMYLDYSEFEDSEEAFADRVKRTKRYNLYTFRSQYGSLFLDKEISDLKEQLYQISDEDIKKKIQNKIKKIEKDKITIAGERVKSIEEAIIANFLFLNGIRYRYEKVYPFDVKENYRKNYRPDFYLPDYDLYWEHFGINEEGRTPWLSEIEEQKYIEGIAWKRELHKKNGTKLIESYSYYNKEGKFEDRLRELLKENNIQTKPIDYAKVYENVFNDSINENMKNFQRLIITFISLFKSNNLNVEWFADVFKLDLTDREILFFRIVKHVFEYYQSFMKSNNTIDFNDVSAGRKSPF